MSAATRGPPEHHIVAPVPRPRHCSEPRPVTRYLSAGPSSGRFSVPSRADYKSAFPFPFWLL